MQVTASSYGLISRPSHTRQNMQNAEDFPAVDEMPEKAPEEEKVRKNCKFFVSIQKITTFACLFGEMP